MTSFFLPADTVYAVRAEAMGDDGTVLATGCVDEVAVRTNRVAMVEVPFEDEPLDVMGDFQVAALLNVGDAGMLLREQVAVQLRSRIATAALGTTTTDEAAFLLSALDRTLRADPVHLAIEESALQLELVSGDILHTLQDALDERGTGPLLAAETLADAVAISLDELTVQAELQLTPGFSDPKASWQTLSISASAISDTLPAPSLDYNNLPWALSGVIYESADDTLSLKEVPLYLPLHLLASQAIHQAVATADDDDMRADDDMRTMDAPLGCDVLLSVWQVWAADLLGGTDCNEACIQSACDRAIANLLTAADSALETDITDLLSTPNSSLEIDLQLLSDCSAPDDCVSLQISGMESRSLSGAWTSLDGQKAALDGSAVGSPTASIP